MNAFRRLTLLLLLLAAIRPAPAAPQARPLDQKIAALAAELFRDQDAGDAQRHHDEKGDQVGTQPLAQKQHHGHDQHGACDDQWTGNQYFLAYQP